MLNWFLICCLTLLSSASPGLAPAWDLSRRPREDVFEIRFVNDIGAPIGARQISVGEVWTSPGSSRWQGLNDAPKRLGADGVLRLAPRRSFTGALCVSFRDKGLFGHAEGDSIDLEWGGEAGRSVVTIPRLATAEGRVLTGAPIDDIGVSIPGATFDWYRPRIEGVYVAWSGPPPTSRGLEVEADGTFRLEGLTPGPIEITLFRGGVRATHQLDLAPGQVVAGLEFHLASGGWVVGTAHDVESRPLRDAHLVARPAEGLWSLFFDEGARTYCDVAEDGAFRLGSLAEGLYRVELLARVPGGSAELPQWNRSVVVASSLVWSDGTSEHGLDLVAPGPPVEVRGRIRGIDASSEAGRVTLRSASAGRGVSTGMDRGGRFELTAPTAGECDLTVVTTKGDRRFGPFTAQVAIMPGMGEVVVNAPTSGLELLLPSAQADVQRARVQVFRSEDGEMLQAFDADDRVPGVDSLLRCDGLAPGLYHVRVQPATWPSDVLFERTVVVARDQRARVRLEAMEFGAVALPERMTRAVADATATAFVVAEGAPLTYPLSRVPPGRHSLVVRQGSLAALVPVEVEPNRVTRLEPKLAPGGIVVVQIVFQGHDTNADVALRHELGFQLDPDSPEHYVLATSGEPYAFDGLPPGRYDVLVEGEVRETVTVDAGESQRLEIERTR